MARTGTLRLSAAGALAVGALLSFAAPAPADQPTATGWWWRGSRAGVVVAPPTVPEGGLWVATEVSDPLAVSAVRSPVDIDLLTLTVADVTGTPAVRACPVVPGWKPAAGGIWEQRPDDQCTFGEVEGVLDGDTMTFAVGALGVPELSLVPIAGAEPFSITFTAAHLVAAPPPTTTSSTTTTTTSTAAPTTVTTRTFTPPPLGATAVTFDPDVDTDTTTTTVAIVPSPDAPDRSKSGQRSPAALAVAAAFLGVWGWRARVAAAAAADHPLARSVAG